MYKLKARCSKCRKCAYSGITQDYITCEYILYENEPRGCSIEECERYKIYPRFATLSENIEAYEFVERRFRRVLL